MTLYYECPECGEELFTIAESHDEINIEDECEDCGHKHTSKETDTILERLGQDFIGEMADAATDWMNDK